VGLNALKSLILTNFYPNNKIQEEEEEQEQQQSKK
jgi:hypothetical protein